MVMARGLGSLRGPDGRTLEDGLLLAARRHGMRVLGGSTFGILSPTIGLNATFSRVAVLPGNVASISQTDAISTLLLDRAHSRGGGPLPLRLPR
jgi:acetyltransferase